MTLAFDASHFGESGGDPRKIEVPFTPVKDFSAAVALRENLLSYYLKMSCSASRPRNVDRSVGPWIGEHQRIPRRLGLLGRSDGGSGSFHGAYGRSGS